MHQDSDKRTVPGRKIFADEHNSFAQTSAGSPAENLDPQPNFFSQQEQQAQAAQELEPSADLPQAQQLEADNQPRQDQASSQPAQASAPTNPVTQAAQAATTAFSQAAETVLKQDYRQIYQDALAATKDEANNPFNFDATSGESDTAAAAAGFGKRVAGATEATDDSQVLDAELQKYYQQQQQDLQAQRAAKKSTAQQVNSDAASVQVLDDQAYRQTLESPTTARSIEQDLDAVLGKNESKFHPLTWLTAGLILFCAGIAIRALYLIVRAVQNGAPAFIFVALGVAIGALAIIYLLVREWIALRRLRGRQDQIAANQLTMAGFAASQNPAQTPAAIAFCEGLLKTLPLSNDAAAVTHWRAMLQPHTTPAQVVQYFQAEVLKPIDDYALNLIHKNARNNALVTAASPYITVDILFMVFRNFGLINQISKLYGVEHSYATKLVLFKHVLVNALVAGASEGLQDLGSDYLGHSLLAKLSTKATQGYGLGLLTGRLGYKTIELVRPLPFHERPSFGTMALKLFNVLDHKNSKTKDQVKPKD